MRELMDGLGLLMYTTHFFNIWIICLVECNAKVNYVPFLKNKLNFCT